MSATAEHADSPAADNAAANDTAVEHAAGEHHHAHDDHVPSDGYFIRIAIILAIVTALETSTYWWPDSMSSFATPALIIMMCIKFFMIVSVFMHLKFDSRIFSAMFYTGLFLAIFVYMVFLFTFQFFRP
jgi:cytochrome c oxidase subunit IV